MAYAMKHSNTADQNRWMYMGNHLQFNTYNNSNNNGNNNNNELKKQKQQ